MKVNELRLIFWELTSQCNLKCIHCRAEATEKPFINELTTKEAYSLIDSIVSFSNPILILTGGEPLYRADVFDIASYANKKGLRIALATNGTLIDEKVAKKILNSGIKRVSISIDGANRETHDSFRGFKGSFDDAIKGFLNLKRLNIEVQFNTTIAKHNINEIEDIYKLAKDMKACALHIFMLVPVGCGVEIADREMVSKEDYERVLNWLYEKSIEDRSLELKATCAPHYFRIMRQRMKKENRSLPKPSHGMSAMTKGCLAGGYVCFISRIGNVQPCGYLPVVAGNVRSEPLERIWKESEVFKRLRDPSLLKGKCGRCEYKMICEGCRARAFYKTGDYMDEEPYCVYVPTSYLTSSGNYS